MRATEVADVSYHVRAGRSIQRRNVEVQVGLRSIAAGSNVYVEWYRRFNVFRIVREQFTFAFSGEVPDQAKSRC